MKAFEVLDQENKGYLTTEELTKYMCEEGINFCSSAVCILELCGQGELVLVGLKLWEGKVQVQVMSTGSVYAADIV